MNDREDGGICADAKRESDNRDERKSGTLEEHTEGQADVREAALHPSQATSFAVEFFGLLHAAEFTPRGVRRLFRVQATPNTFFGKQVEVALQLSIQVLLKPPLAEYIPQSC